MPPCGRWSSGKKGGSSGVLRKNEAAEGGNNAFLVSTFQADIEKPVSPHETHLS